MQVFEFCSFELNPCVALGDDEVDMLEKPQRKRSQSQTSPMLVLQCSEQ